MTIRPRSQEQEREKYNKETSLVPNSVALTGCPRSGRQLDLGFRVWIGQASLPLFEGGIGDVGADSGRVVTLILYGIACQAGDKKLRKN